MTYYVYCCVLQNSWQGLSGYVLYYLFIALGLAERGQFYIVYSGIDMDQVSSAHLMSPQTSRELELSLTTGRSQPYSSLLTPMMLGTGWKSTAVNNSWGCLGKNSPSTTAGMILKTWGTCKGHGGQFWCPLRNPTHYPCPHLIVSGCFSTPDRDSTYIRIFDIHFTHVIKRIPNHKAGVICLE